MRSEALARACLTLLKTAMVSSVHSGVLEGRLVRLGREWREWREWRVCRIVAPFGMKW